MIFAFMEFTVYCERNTWVKVVPAMGTYTGGKCYEGEEQGLEGETSQDLKEGWRITSTRAWESFPGRGNSTHQGLPLW